jgi:hypothetical protein
MQRPLRLVGAAGVHGRVGKLLLAPCLPHKGALHHLLVVRLIPAQKRHGRELFDGPLARRLEVVTDEGDVGRVYVMEGLMRSRDTFSAVRG